MSEIRLKHVAGLAACQLGTWLSTLGNRVLHRYGHHLEVHDGVVAKPMPTGPRSVWFDIGAHLGELTLEAARSNPSLVVYAFEPNLRLAATLSGELANYVVIPQAISDVTGYRPFHLNTDDATSSLLQVNPSHADMWHGPEPLRTERTALVPTIRLDEAMAALRLDRVDFVKIDAQGHDYEVLQSLGDRIRDVDEIMVEARLVAQAQYCDAVNTRETITSFLLDRGFVLVGSTTQTYGQETNLRFRRKQSF